MWWIEAGGQATRSEPRDKNPAEEEVLQPVTQASCCCVTGGSSDNIMQQLRENKTPS